MKTTISLLAMLALAVMPAFAAAGTLYQQEEGTNDQDPVEVNAAGANSNADASWTNWKYQYGSASWSGIYAGSDGWLNIAGGDETQDLKVEADIEMYCATTLVNGNIYFHVGNPYNLTQGQRTAYASGTMASNNGQYIGLYLPGKAEGDINFTTGVITNGMHSDHDTYRAQNNNMDLKLLLAVDGGAYEPPLTYGEGSHGTIVDTLWWLVNGGAPGSYTLSWLVEILPIANQPDGDYYLDPTVVTAPVL
jgi:phage gp45-like